MKPRDLQSDINLLKTLRRKSLPSWVERKLFIKMKRAMPFYFHETKQLRLVNKLQEVTICRYREELANMRLRLRASTNDKMEFKPATKFTGSTIFQQRRHMLSEFIELTWELIWGNYFKAAMEITDYQVSGATMQEILGFDSTYRRVLLQLVNQKNKARGYFEDPKGSK